MNEHREGKWDWLQDARKDYLSTAPRKIIDLENAISGFAMNPTNRMAERKLRLLLHNLIGSGSSYGFHAVTDIARGMSERLKNRSGEGDSSEQVLISDLKRSVEHLRKAFSEAKV